MPGVIAVFTAADLELQPTPSPFNPMVARTLLATDKVRYVGEPIAAVVAETRGTGRRRRRAVIVDYRLPAERWSTSKPAMTSTTLIYEAPAATSCSTRPRSACPRTPATSSSPTARSTVTGRFVNQRVAPCPLEVRGAAAAWIDGRLHQWVSTQHAQGIKDADRRRQRGRRRPTCASSRPTSAAASAPRSARYPEELLLGPIAKRIGRPVRWRETRSESMMALGHGRAQLQYVTIGGSRDGKVTHYQLHAIQDCGGFVEIGAILAPFMTRPMSSGVYAIPNIECRTTSRRHQHHADRRLPRRRSPRGHRGDRAGDGHLRRRDRHGPGRGAPDQPDPEVHRAAHHGDRPDLRRRRLRGRARQGARRGRLRRAARRAGQRAGSRATTSSSASASASYVEITGGVPPVGRRTPRSRCTTTARAIVYTGTSPHGQGHDTAWSMIATRADRHPDGPASTLVWGDTDLVPDGRRHDGLALAAAGWRRRWTRPPSSSSRRPRSSPPTLLEADEADIVLDKDAGAFHVAGTPAVSKTWAELAGAVEGRRPADDRHASSGGSGADVPVRCPRRRRRGRHRDRPGAAPPPRRLRRRRPRPQPDAARGPDPRRHRPGHGAGAARRGPLRRRRQPDHVEPRRLRDDLGRRAARASRSSTWRRRRSSTRSAPRASARSGTIGSTPAVQSAVVDAVSHLGVRHIDMPATAEKVWRAIQAAG